MSSFEIQTMFGRDGCCAGVLLRLRRGANDSATNSDDAPTGIRQIP